MANTTGSADDSCTTVTMTEAFIIEQCKKHHGYSTPELNEKLYLHHFGFSRLHGLEAFTGCTVLYLSHNALSQLDGLAALTQLDSLYLSCNALISLETLPVLPSLRTLDVAENSLTTIDGLDRAAPLLQTLLVSHNRLSQLNGLQGCTALLSLDVSHNALENEEKVDAGLQPLRCSLRTLLLHGNALCRTVPHYRKRWIVTFPSLKFLDDYPVFDDERERAEAFATGGALAEEATRQAQKERAAAAAQAQHQYYGELRDRNRQTRQRDGPTREPTAYYLAHSTDSSVPERGTCRGKNDDDDGDYDVYIPAAAAHTDPQGV
jgi:dynein assembly factor 1, axonemal